MEGGAGGISLTLVMVTPHTPTPCTLLLPLLLMSDLSGYKCKAVVLLGESVTVWHVLVYLVSQSNYYIPEVERSNSVLSGPTWTTGLHPN